MKLILLKQSRYILVVAAVLFLIALSLIGYKIRMEKIILPALSEEIFHEVHDSINPVIEGARNVAEDPFLQNWMETEQDRAALDEFLKARAVETGCSAIDLASVKTSIAYQSAGTQVIMNRDNDRDYWFYSLADSQKNTSLEMYYDTLTGILYVYYNLKIYNRQNEFTGILGMLIQYDKLAAHMKRFESENRNIYCINRSGEVIIHSDQTKIGTVPIYDAYGFLQSPKKPENELSYLDDETGHWFFRMGPVFRDVRYLPDLDIYLVIEHDLSPAGLLRNL